MVRFLSIAALVAASSLVLAAPIPQAAVNPSDISNLNDVIAMKGVNGEIVPFKERERRDFDDSEFDLEERDCGDEEFALMERQAALNEADVSPLNDVIAMKGENGQIVPFMERRSSMLEETEEFDERDCGDEFEERDFEDESGLEERQVAINEANVSPLNDVIAMKGENGNIVPFKKLSLKVKRSDSELLDERQVAVDPSNVNNINDVIAMKGVNGEIVPFAKRGEESMEERDFDDC